MATYTLYIEDKIGTGANVTERAVLVKGILSYEKLYNPNAESKKPFDYNRGEFDTSFSIVHPFREVARVITLYEVIQRKDKPIVNYDCSVNGAQRTLFENILDQEYDMAGKSQQGF